MNQSKIPKYLQVAAALEARAQQDQNGTNGRFPSVREIAEEFKISLVTALRALQVLRDKGLINTVDRSGNFLNQPAKKQAETYGLFLHMTPGPWQRTTTNVTLASFQDLSRETGICLVSDILEVHERITQANANQQVRAAIDRGIRGLFLLPSRISEASACVDQMLTQACRRFELPVVLIERNLRGVLRPYEFDLVAIDDFGGGACCTQHLLDSGCRHIVFVTGSPTSSHNKRIGGYLFALHKARSPQIFPPTVLQEPADQPIKQVYRHLTHQILSLKADGVICYEDYTVIGLVMELMMNDVKVPKNVRLVGFDDLPIGDTLPIGVSTYACPPLELARQALRLMRNRCDNPADPPVQVVLPGKLIVRESSRV